MKTTLIYVTMACVALAACPADKCQDYFACGEVSSNATLNRCITQGNKVCSMLNNLGKKGSNAVAATECQSYQSCCDGQCCDHGQGCVVRQSGLFIYQGKRLDAALVARNGWKLADGTKLKNKPRMCSKENYLNPTTGAKVVFIPLIALIVVVLGTLGAISAGAELKQKKNIPAMILLFCCVFLLLSQMWPYALVLALSAIVGLVVTDQKAHWMLLFQLVFLWILLGGSNFFLGPLSSGSNLISGMNGSSLDQLTASCSTYYNYFTFTETNKPWHLGPVDKQWGYCSRSFIGFQVVMAIFAVFSFVLMMLQTSFQYMAGGKKDALLNDHS